MKLQFAHNLLSELEWRVYSISQLAETTVLTKTALLNLTGEMTLQLNMNYAIFLCFKQFPELDLTLPKKRKKKFYYLLLLLLVAGEMMLVLQSGVS